MLKLTYKHPRTGKRIIIKQAVLIARQQPFELKVGAGASLVCWGDAEWDAAAPIVFELVLIPPNTRSI